MLTSIVTWAFMICQASPQATPAQECIRWMCECQIYELQMSDGRSLEFIQEQCGEAVPPELIYDAKGK